MNEVMFLLCLLGILSYLHKRETAAAAFFVAGAFIKVLPVFFLIWLLSKGNWQNSLKNGLKIGAIAAICVLLPMLFRGFEQGWTDHLRYYETFLEPFQKGRVEPQFCNYSLSSMLYNWCQPTQNEPLGYSYRLFMLTFVQTKLLYKICALTLVGAWFSLLAYSRFVTQKTSFWELVYTFLLMNLLSGITWEYHLVAIIFVFIPILYTILEKNTVISVSHRLFLYIILAVSFFLNIVGTDTVGEKGMHYIGGYGLLTVVWLLLTCYSVYRFFSENTKIHEV